MDIYLCYDQSYSTWEFKDSLPKRITSETKYGCKVMFLSPETVDDQIRVIPKDAIIFNYCDGSVDGDFILATKLRKAFRKLIGAGPECLGATEKKSTITKLLQAAKVSVLPVITIDHLNDLKSTTLKDKLGKMGLPLFVKVEAGYDSMGLTERSICETIEEVYEQCREILSKYGPCVIQRYLNGREYTIPVTGKHTVKDSMKAWRPIERIFRERSFTYQWDQSDKWRLLEETDLDIGRIKALACDAWIACKGDSYGRVDIRQDAKTLELFVLEVNAVCSIAPGSLFDIGLSAEGGSFAQCIDQMIELS